MEKKKVVAKKGAGTPHAPSKYTSDDVVIYCNDKFLICCSFNGCEWFFIFSNKIPFLRSIYGLIFFFHYLLLFRKNVRMSIIPLLCSLLLGLHLEWPLNTSADKKSNAL